MNKENTAKLLKTFPKIYPKQNPLFMAKNKPPFVFLCDDGWFDLIWELSETVNLEIIRMEAESGIAIKPPVIQVKEKFAGLRYYTGLHNELIDEAIRRAEERSAVTCEKCGKPGKLCGETWFYTLCDEHDAERIKTGRGIARTSPSAEREE